MTAIIRLPNTVFRNEYLENPVNYPVSIVGSWALSLGNTMDSTSKGNHLRIQNKAPTFGTYGLEIQNGGDGQYCLDKETASRTIIAKIWVPGGETGYSGIIGSFNSSFQRGFAMFMEVSANLISLTATAYIEKLPGQTLKNQAINIGHTSEGSLLTVAVRLSETGGANGTGQLIASVYQDDELTSTALDIASDESVTNRKLQDRFYVGSIGPNSWYPGYGEIAYAGVYSSSLSDADLLAEFERI